MSERQELTFRGAMDGTSLHGTLDRPTGAEGRRPTAVIHRGIVTSDADNDFLEALASSLVDAGMTVLRFEPRTAGLILDDFHAFTLANDRDDVRAAIQELASRDDVDGRRVGLIGWALGAMAACSTARNHAALERLCLINPATPSFVLSRLQRSNGSPTPLDPEHVPRAFAHDLESADSASDASVHEHATLIVHAAADRMVPPAVSLEYLRVLERANRAVERVAIARADHAFAEAATRQACIERVVRFFSQPAAIERNPATVGAQA